MQSLHSPAIRTFFAAVLMLRFQNKDVGDKLTSGDICIGLCHTTDVLNVFNRSFSCLHAPKCTEHNIIRFIPNEFHVSPVLML